MVATTRGETSTRPRSWDWISVLEALPPFGELAFVLEFTCATIVR